MMINRIKKFFTSIITTSLIILYSSSIQTHPIIVVASEDNESYAVSFKRGDSLVPEFFETTKDNPTQLSGIVRNLTVASDDGYYGKFTDIDLEDEHYEIVFDRAAEVLMLVKSAGEGHTVWTPLLRTVTPVE